MSTVERILFDVYDDQALGFHNPTNSSDSSNKEAE